MPVGMVNILRGEDSTPLVSRVFSDNISFETVSSGQDITGVTTQAGREARRTFVVARSPVVDSIQMGDFVQYDGVKYTVDGIEQQDLSLVLEGVFGRSA